jgi:tRNA A-37 threonylcarbamoyl transferase component Bud32
MMQCPKCKQTLEDGVKFCPNDGTPLGDTAATLTAPTPTAAGPGQRPPGVEVKLPAVVGGRYRLEEVRGGGGMARVYRAIDITLEREVAVKLINPDLRNETEFDARFSREARIASQLADPHIVVVHDYGIDSELGPFLVMEYLQGQSLRERIAAEGKLPYKAALQLGGQVLLALMHAHDKGIVHRDIKPDNVFLLNQSGIRLHVRVLDFGIARIYRGDSANASNTITHAGAVLGTPRYMSPEQLAGLPADARSDLYSAGLLLFEAVTGQLPYVQGKRLCELAPDATEQFQELIEDCLKPNPADRPSSALEAYLRLQELGKASGILLMPPGAMERLLQSRKKAEPTVVQPPPEPFWSRRWVLISVAVLLVGALAGGLWYFFSDPVPPAGAEVLAGVRVGDLQEEAETRFSWAGPEVGNPWGLKEKAVLGHVLAPSDLGLKDDELPQVKAHWSADGSTTLVSHNGKVRAVIIRKWGWSLGTGRGMSVGNDVNRLYRLYPRGGQDRAFVLPDGTEIIVRRYDKLGLGFEIEGRNVTGITLYPAKQ